MNSYPSNLIPADGSYQELFDPVLISVARSGSAHIRRLQSGTKNRFHITHSLLSSSLRDAFTTFYNANRSVTFLFTWIGDGLTYTVMFAENSMKLKPTVNLLWEINFQLVEQ